MSEIRRPDDDGGTFNLIRPMVPAAITTTHNFNQRLTHFKCLSWQNEMMIDNKEHKPSKNTVKEERKVAARLLDSPNVLCQLISSRPVISEFMFAANRKWKCCKQRKSGTQSQWVVDSTEEEDTRIHTEQSPFQTSVGGEGGDQRKTVRRQTIRLFSIKIRTRVPILVGGGGGFGQGCVLQQKCRLLQNDGQPK